MAQLKTVKKVSDRRRGLVIEMAIGLMLLCMALCAIAISYTAAIQKLATAYDATTTDKMAADQIAANYLKSYENFDGTEYGDYSFVTDTQDINGKERYYCEVYRYSDVIEYIKEFLADPVEVVLYNSSATLSEYTIYVVYDGGDLTLNLYNNYGGSLSLLFTIRAEKVPIYDSDGHITGYLTDNGRNVYEPTKIEYPVTQGQYDEETQEYATVTTTESVVYSFENMRVFYQKIASPLIYLEVEDGQFIKYQYGDV